MSVTTFLSFVDQAEAAAALYTSVFPNSRVTDTMKMNGAVLTVSFELDGRPFVAMNGGPHFGKFTESISLSTTCDTQDEIDRIWGALVEGGAESMCGWLRDRFGVSWQVVPSRLTSYLGHPDPAKAQRAMAAMLQMRKFDIGVLEAAIA